LDRSRTRLNRQELLTQLKAGTEIKGGAAVQSATPVSREGAVMGFSTKQLRALRRDVDYGKIRTREVNGRNLSYSEGWHLIAASTKALAAPTLASRQTGDSFPEQSSAAGVAPETALLSPDVTFGARATQSILPQAPRVHRQVLASQTDETASQPNSSFEQPDAKIR